MSTDRWMDKEDMVHIYNGLFSSVQFLGHVRLFATPWTAAHQASLSITNSWSSLRLISIESVMPSNHLILCCPLLLPLSILPSIRVFSSESVLHIRWPKYWSFSLNISPSNEHSELISLRMDWLDLVAVQGTLKSLLQHHSLKASILWQSAFFIVQLLHPYMTTGKTIALTRRTFVGKVMSLLFNMLSITRPLKRMKSHHLQQMDLEIIALNQVKTKTNIIWYHLYRKSKKKKKSHKWTYLKNKGDSQTSRTNLLLLEVMHEVTGNFGVWDWHIHTAIFKTDNQGSTV